MSLRDIYMKIRLDYYDAEEDLTKFKNASQKISSINLRMKRGVLGKNDAIAELEAFKNSSRFKKVTEIDLQLKAGKKISREDYKILKEYMDLQKQINKINAGSKGGFWSNTLASIKLGWIAVYGVLQKVGQAFNKIIVSVKQYAKYLEMQKSTANQFGIDPEETVKKLRKASNNTISNYKLLESANKAFTLNVTTDVNKLAKLMEFARIRAKALGTDSSQAFSDLMTGIGRNSPLILDNLGIITKGWAEQAKSAGKAYDSQFILQKVLEQAGEAAKKSGGNVKSLNDGFEKMTALAENLGIRLGKMFSRLFTMFIPIIDGINELLDKLDEAQGGLMIDDKFNKKNKKWEFEIEITSITAAEKSLKNIDETKKNLINAINKQIADPKYGFNSTVSDLMSELPTELNNRLSDEKSKLNNALRKVLLDISPEEKQKAVKEFMKIYDDYRNQISTAIQAKNKEIENATKTSSKDLTAMNEALLRLEKMDSKSLGGYILDELKNKLSGVISDFVKLGDSIAVATDKSTGLESTAKKIEAVKIELEALSKTGDDKQIEIKTGELESLIKLSGDMQAGLAAGIVSVAQGLADTAKAFWDQYDSTISKLDSTILSETKKSSMAFQDAWQSALESLANNIPIIGGLIAKLLDSIIETDSEKREKMLKEIAKSESEFQHQMNMGSNKSLDDQINFYGQILERQKAAGAELSDIYATEEKIKELKDQQIEQWKKQAELAKEIQKLSAGLYGKSASEQVGYWQNKIEELKTKIGNMSIQNTNQNLGTISSLTQKIASINTAINSVQETIDKATRWLTSPETYAQWENLKRWLETNRAELQSQLDYYNGVNKAAAENNVELQEQIDLLKEAEYQLELIQGDVLRYQTEYFEHALKMDTKSSEENKNEQRIKYYTELLKKIAEVNSEYDELTSLKEDELETQEEILKAAQNAGNTASAEAAQEQVDLLKEELSTIESERYTTQEIWSIEEKITDLREAQTEEIEKQLGLLEKMGLFDKENLGQIRNSSIELARSGVVGVDNYSALAAAGVSNRSIASSQLGKSILQIGSLNSYNMLSTADAAATRTALLIARRIRGYLN